MTAFQTPTFHTRTTPTWRMTRTLILAAGPVLSVLWIASQHLAPSVSAVGVVVVLLAWSPLLPFGAHGLLCVDERAETLQTAPSLLRDVVGGPVMLVASNARLETWVGTASCAVAWALWQLIG
jgi:hypothetical protein